GNAGKTPENDCLRGRGPTQAFRCLIIPVCAASKMSATTTANASRGGESGEGLGLAEAEVVASVDNPADNVEQSVVLGRHLKDLGTDLIEVSSGGLVPKVRTRVGRGYQVPFARRFRDEAGIMTGAVGLITEPRHADEIVTGGDADLVFIARELLRGPYWALKAQPELGAEPSWPAPHGYAVKRRAK